MPPAGGAVLKRVLMKVLVVSNHNFIGEFLVTLVHGLPARDPIEPSLCLTSAAAAEIGTLAPDVIVIEAVSDFANAMAATRTLKSTVPGIQILVIGQIADEASAFDAISAGANGYLEAHASGNVLLATLEGLMRGELGLSRATALRVVQHLRREAHPAVDLPTDILERLTRREREVFQLVRRGIRSREIAAQLSIAEATVYKHIQNILEKLQMRSRTQAVFLMGQEPSAVPSGSPTGAQGSTRNVS
jgi:DNA-binding NarL/FixJ family response regulator